MARRAQFSTTSRWKTEILCISFKADFNTDLSRVSDKKKLVANSKVIPDLFPAWQDWQAYGRAGYRFVNVLHVQKVRPLKQKQLMNNVWDTSKNACKYSCRVSVTYVPFLTEILTFGEVQCKSSTAHTICSSHRMRRGGQNELTRVQQLRNHRNWTAEKYETVLSINKQNSANLLGVARISKYSQCIMRVNTWHKITLQLQILRLTLFTFKDPVRTAQ